MNCDGVKQLLSEGLPLDMAAREHLAGCEGCRRMMASLEQKAEVPAGQIEQLTAMLATSMEPVRPLPSNTVMLLVTVAAFVAVSALLAATAGFHALQVLSFKAEVVYYGAILLLAVLFSQALVEQMIPGAKRHGASWVLMARAAVVLVAVPLWLFQDRRLNDFVANGMPCLRFGSLMAVIGGLLGWFLVRRGFLTTPRETITVLGYFAGLMGVAVLALHCPILNAMHILVWHLGAIVLGVLVGAIVGGWRESAA